MTTEPRPYRKQRRAELEAQTRLRITQSTVELHGTVGPARTTVSAIAEHAGVRRSTVYRHFPDEASLLEACSAHWMEANPLPDIEEWATTADPDERLRTALRHMYARYRRTERMMDNLLRDEQLSPVVQQTFGGFRGFLAAIQETLMRGRRSRGATRGRVEAAVGHALAFPTWRSLVREQGLDDEQAVELMCRMVAAAAAPA